MKGVYMLNTTYMYGMYSYLVRTQKTRINIGCNDDDDDTW